MSTVGSAAHLAGRLAARTGRVATHRQCGVALEIWQIKWSAPTRTV